MILGWTQLASRVLDISQLAPLLVCNLCVLIPAPPQPNGAHPMQSRLLHFVFTYKCMPLRPDAYA